MTRIRGTIMRRRSFLSTLAAVGPRSCCWIGEGKAAFNDPTNWSGGEIPGTGDSITVTKGDFPPWKDVHIEPTTFHTVTILDPDSTFGISGGFTRNIELVKHG